MLVDCMNFYAIERGHHFLCQPDVFVLITHFDTFLTVAGSDNKGQVSGLAQHINTVSSFNGSGTEKMAKSMGRNSVRISIENSVDLPAAQCPTFAAKK